MWFASKNKYRIEWSMVEVRPVWGRAPNETGEIIGGSDTAGRSVLENTSATNLVSWHFGHQIAGP
jgi:hypothetical protein